MNTGAQMRTRVQAQPWLLHRGDFAVCGQQHRSGCEKRVSGRDQQAPVGLRLTWIGATPYTRTTWHRETAE
jgi:hypothetical protein